MNSKKKLSPMTRLQGLKQCVPRADLMSSGDWLRCSQLPDSVPNDDRDFYTQLGTSYCPAGSCEGALSFQPHSHCHGNTTYA